MPPETSAQPDTRTRLRLRPAGEGDITDQQGINPASRAELHQRMQGWVTSGTPSGTPNRVTPAEREDRAVTLDVLLHNERAWSFYRSLGFAEHARVLRLTGEACR